MAKQYKNLRSLWKAEVWDMYKRATEEITEMLKAMGVAPDEYYNLQRVIKRDRYYVTSVKFFEKDGEVRIGCLYETSEPKPWNRNYAEYWGDPGAVTIVHSYVRRDYNKFIKQH